MKELVNNHLFAEIKEILESSRNRVVKSVNTEMTVAYFETGKIIVEHEQKGSLKAEYGAEILKNLSKRLIREFGRGFSVTNLKQMRSFFLVYSKGRTLSDEFKNNNLSWSHYILLMRLDEKERDFYERESIENNWSLRELKRQFDSSLFDRISLSTDKKGVLKDNLEKYHSPENPQDIIKTPTF